MSQDPDTTYYYDVTISVLIATTTNIDGLSGRQYDEYLMPRVIAALEEGGGQVEAVDLDDVDTDS